MAILEIRTLAFAALVVAATVAGCASAGSGASSTELGTRDWRLVEVGGVPAVPADPARRPWIRFSVDSSHVNGNAGCNRFGGSFTREGLSLRFGPMMSTRMACADDALNRQEQAFLSALGSTDHYEITGGTLVVLRASERLARFVH
ncbi:MAG: META domain-containing protein [Gemmatimonadota bacterium]